MKIYKLLHLLLVFSVVLSCSQDTDVNLTADQPEPKIAADQFDNSYLGVYKGLFTTEDGLTRGSVEVTLTPNSEGIAQISLSTGEQIELKSSRVKLTLDQKVSQLRFSSEGLSAKNVSLEFTVDGDGAEPTISNVSFENQVSDILIAKNLSRAPLTPITGTYVRTAGAGNFPNSGRTWNVMTIGAGDGQAFATQIAFDGQVYNSIPENNMQSNCMDGTALVSCEVTGTSNILGYDVLWNGTHQYNLIETVTCSSISGTWSAPEFGGSSGTFTSDVDSMTCATEVIIGTQTWKLRNLDVDTYNNGDPIPHVQDNTEWSNLTTGAWCYYNNDPANGAIYGKLYNWYALNDPRGVTPEGWHLPNASNWNTLKSYLGGNNIAGGKMKSVTGWNEPNVDATNESGFTGLPGGQRFEFGGFNGIGGTAVFNSFSTSVGLSLLYSYSGNASAGGFGPGDGGKTRGLSVRLVKD